MARAKTSAGEAAADDQAQMEGDEPEVEAGQEAEKGAEQDAPAPEAPAPETPAVLDALPRLLMAIDAYSGGDAFVHGRLVNVYSAAADLMRVIAEVPEGVPADIRASLDAVLARL